MRFNRPAPQVSAEEVVRIEEELKTVGMSEDELSTFYPPCDVYDEGELEGRLSQMKDNDL
jgi:hypothetical protein